MTEIPASEQVLPFAGITCVGYVVNRKILSGQKGAQNEFGFEHGAVED